MRPVERREGGREREGRESLRLKVGREKGEAGGVVGEPGDELLEERDRVEEIWSRTVSSVDGSS